MSLKTSLADLLLTTTNLKKTKTSTHNYIRGQRRGREVPPAVLASILRVGGVRHAQADVKRNAVALPRNNE
mgnify:CR=1 FL=1